MVDGDDPPVDAVRTRNHSRVRQRGALDDEPPMKMVNTNPKCVTHGFSSLDEIDFSKINPRHSMVKPARYLAVGDMLDFSATIADGLAGREEAYPGLFEAILRHCGSMPIVTRKRRKMKAQTLIEVYVGRERFTMVYPSDHEFLVFL